MKASVVILSGWAQSSESLGALRRRLEDDFAPQGLSVHELVSEESRFVDKWPSAFAKGLSERLGELSQPVHIVAWSMGGMVALEAARYFPSLVSRLVLINSGARFCSSPDYPFGVDKSRVRALAQGLRVNARQALENFYSEMYSKKTSSKVVRGKVEYSLSIKPEMLICGLDYLQKVDLCSELSRIEKEVLIVHAKDDRVISCEAASYLYERLSRGRQLMVDDADHGLPEHRPESFVGEVVSFLTSNRTLDA